MGLKGKRLESEKGEKALEEVKKNFSIQLLTQRESYEKMI